MDEDRGKELNDQAIHHHDGWMDEDRGKELNDQAIHHHDGWMDEDRGKEFNDQAIHHHDGYATGCSKCVSKLGYMFCISFY